MTDMSVVGIPANDVPLHRNDPCSCHSGLKYKNCCGLLQPAIPGPPQIELVEEEYQAGVAALSEGNSEQALRYFIEVLEQVPCHIRALRMLYKIQSESDNSQAAEALLRRLIHLMPQDDWAYAELAMRLYEKSDLPGAEQHARNVVRLSPDNAQGHNLMGMILTDAHRLQAGEFHYRRALSLHGPVGKLCANLALNLERQGKLEEADEFYCQAMELEPDNMASFVGWLKLKEINREFDTARSMLSMLEQRLPATHISVCMSRSVLCRRNRDFTGALTALDNADPARCKNNPVYHYERGEVFDKLGRYDDAFTAVDEANRLIREQGRGIYGEEAAQDLAKRLQDFFISERIQKLPKGIPDPNETAKPVFIVGFPRSGTTMVEQILTGHGAINAGDELNFIWELAAATSKILNSNLAYPECLADLWFGDNQAALGIFRDFYLRKARELGITEGDSLYFTDKMPLNETHLGLIHLVFPEAPVIHLIRHPLDVVLSCYFNDLTHGNNCSYNLESTARHYVLTRGLLDHYLDNLDINYLSVRYEDIVSDPEPNCRRLFDFIGVDWDPRCMDFHQNPRYARTASYAQVSERLYDRSCYRYRNYLHRLEPVIPMLESVITRMGYTI